jgi:hypothetical protein
MAKHQDQQAAFNLGFNDHGEGFPLKENPYDAGTVEARLWAEGWERAAKAEKLGDYTNENCMPA